MEHLTALQITTDMIDAISTCKEYPIVDKIEAYAAQEVAKATEWKPIETAPRKTLLVGWYESVFTIACSRDGNGCQSGNQIVWMEKQASPKYNSKDIWLVKGFDKEGKRIEIKPTHYRPDVPPPPKPITK